MTLAALLVVIAIILAAVALFVPVHSLRLVAAAVILLGIALLLGVTPLVVT